MSWAISSSRPDDGRRSRDGLSGFRADEREHRYRRLATFHLEVAQRLEDEAVLETPGGRLSDDDRARLGEGLDSRRDVGRISEGHGSRLRRTDEPHGRLAAVDPDPDGEVCEAPCRLDVARVFGDDLEDAEGGAGGALGIVVVRGRHAEVRADPVALVGLHHAAVLLYCAAHHRHALADERLHLVRGEPLAEGGRADDVREEDGDGADLVLGHRRSVMNGSIGGDVAYVTFVSETGAVDWPLLADLPSDDVRELLSVARRRTFAKGEVVFHRDDPAESLHLIVRGRFAARVASQVGDSVLLDVLGPGQAFGELALLLPGERRSATVSALEDGETRSVFRDDFTRLQQSHPGVKDVLLRLLAEQVRRTSDRIVEAHHVDADTRVRGGCASSPRCTAAVTASRSCLSRRTIWLPWRARRERR